MKTLPNQYAVGFVITVLLNLSLVTVLGATMESHGRCGFD